MTHCSDPITFLCEIIWTWKGNISCRNISVSLPVFTVQHTTDFNFTQCQSSPPHQFSGQCHSKPLPTCCRVAIVMSCGISTAHFDFRALGRWVGLFRERRAACSLQSTQFTHACCLTDAGADCLWQLSGCKHQTVLQDGFYYCATHQHELTHSLCNTQTGWQTKNNNWKFQRSKLTHFTHTSSHVLVSQSRIQTPYHSHTFLLV